MTRRGGLGIAVGVDHADDGAVAALFDRIRGEHDGLDLLVANACDGNALPFRPAPFWEQPLEHWHNMIDVGVRSHLVAAHHAAPLLLARGRGLVVLTGYRADRDGVTGGHLFYDLAMHAVSRLGHDLAHDLAPHGITALTLSPGFTRTEAIAAQIEAFPPGTDSVERPGRAVRALLEDPGVARYAGGTLTVAELAEVYGFDEPA